MAKSLLACQFLFVVVAGSVINTLLDLLLIFPLKAVLFINGLLRTFCTGHIVCQICQFVFSLCTLKLRSFKTLRFLLPLIIIFAFTLQKNAKKLTRLRLTNNYQLWQFFFSFCQNASVYQLLWLSHLLPHFWIYFQNSFLKSFLKL